MAIAIETSREITFAAELTARSSATFLRLSPFAADAVPEPGSYAGCIYTPAGTAPCAIRVLEDGVSVWCQPRGPMPRLSVGQGMWITVFADREPRS
jgi:hypothetical protein